MRGINCIRKADADGRTNEDVVPSGFFFLPLSSPSTSFFSLSFSNSSSDYWSVGANRHHRIPLSNLYIYWEFETSWRQGEETESLIIVLICNPLPLRSVLGDRILRNNRFEWERIIIVRSCPFVNIFMPKCVVGLIRIPDDSHHHLSRSIIRCIDFRPSRSSSSSTSTFMLTRIVIQLPALFTMHPVMSLLHISLLSFVSNIYRRIILSNRFRLMRTSMFENINRR